MSEKRFARRVSLFTLGTMISRVLGLIREQVFAYLFGAGMATDAFNVAFRIPNFLRDVLAENAFSAAFVPEVVESLARKKREDVWRFASNVATVMLIGVSLIVLLLVIFAPQIVRGIARGFLTVPAEQLPGALRKLALTTELSQIMMPLLLFVALAAWAAGLLNSLGSFFVPAVAPGIANLFSILLPLGLYGYLQSKGFEPITGMALGITMGAFCQFLIQWWALRRRSFVYRFVLDLRDAELRQVLFVRLPFRAMGLATWQVNFLISTFLITFLAERSLTYLNYGYRIMHLPAGLFGVAIGSVALVELSGQAADGNIEGLREKLLNGLRLVAVIMLPMAAIMIALAVPLVRIIYQHGRFTAEDTQCTAYALMLYSLGVWAPAASRCVASGFYALKDTKTPALTGLVAVGLCIVMNLALMNRIGYRAFALNTAVAQIVDFVLLYLLFRRKTRIAGLGTGILLLAKIAGLATASGVFVYVLFRALTGLLSQKLLVVLGETLFCGFSGLVFVYLLAELLGVKEVKSTVIELKGALWLKPVGSEAGSRTR